MQSVGLFPMSVANRRHFLIATAVCGVLLAGAVPFLRRAWSTEADNACISNLRQIDGAKQYWAEQQHKSTNDTPTLADLQPIMLPGRPNEPLVLECRKGGTYTIGRVGEPPKCSYPRHELPQ